MLLYACYNYLLIHTWIPPCVSQVEMVSSMTNTLSYGSASFVVDLAIHGYHIFDPIQFLKNGYSFKQEVGNSHDPMSIAVKKLISGERTIVGHVLKRIYISLVLRRCRSITCIVDGLRHYSDNLPQESLEFTL